MKERRRREEEEEEEEGKRKKKEDSSQDQAKGMETEFMYGFYEIMYEFPCLVGL